MAAPSMSMNKVIHGAVRRDLARFASALAAFSEGDRDRAAALHRAWANFDVQLTEHHEGEHEVAWPAMEAIGIPVATLDGFESEHQAMADALATARTAMDDLARSASLTDAGVAAHAVTELQAVTVTHLDHEEQATEPVLAEHHDAPAVKEMGKKFGRRASPPVAGVFFAWVHDGATPAALAALRESVPSPVLAIIGGLFGRRYRKEIAPVWAH